jgi:hypothetical protein
MRAMSDTKRREHAELLRSFDRVRARINTVTVIARDYRWHRRTWQPGWDTRFVPELVRFIDAIGHEHDPDWHRREWTPI